MQRRAVRLTLLALLLASGFLAAFFAWSTEQRLNTIDTQRTAAESTVDRLLPSVAGIAAAQEAYVQFGERDQQAFARVSSLLDQVATDAAGLKSIAPSAGGSAPLEEFWTTLSALMSADTKAKESLAAGEALAAADVLLASTRPQVASLGATLQQFRDAEIAAHVIAARKLRAQSLLAIGATAALWSLGLVLFASIPAAPRQSVEQSVATPQPVASPAPTVVDLTAAAQLAASIAQLNDASALPALLDRAASLLEARGLVVWMGAGDELFAAVGHGYDASVLQRLRPISRNAENATADAWRSGELRAVAADGTGYGALVAPMIGAAGSVGVLAAEVKAGREDDATTRAMTSMIASQLAGVLAAWPAASTPADADSDRQAAAS